MNLYGSLQNKLVKEVKMIGQFQKISIHHDGRLQYFNPPLPSKIPKCVTPPCPQNSIIVNPPLPLGISLFPQTLRNYQMCSQNAQLGLFYVNRFHITPLLWEKIGKKMISAYLCATATTYRNFTLYQTATEH